METGMVDYVARNKVIKDLYGKGDKTLQEVGDQFGISRERVRQIYISGTPIQREPPKIYIVLRGRKTCLICRNVIVQNHNYKQPSFCRDCYKKYKLWKDGRDYTRALVRARDNNTCQACGRVWQETEKKSFDVHHLNGKCGKLSLAYDKVEDMGGLITVCHKCHYNLEDHAKYGRKKNEVHEGTN